MKITHICLRGCVTIGLVVLLSACTTGHTYETYNDKFDKLSHIVTDLKKDTKTSAVEKEIYYWQRVGEIFREYKATTDNF